MASPTLPGRAGRARARQRPHPNPSPAGGFDEQSLAVHGDSGSPPYTAAALTDEMVWTIPTLAGASALAASLKRPEDPRRAVDEGDTDDASSKDATLTAA